MANVGDITPASLCNCSAKENVHVHCICRECNGKAVNYRTQQLHLNCQPPEKRQRQDIVVPFCDATTSSDVNNEGWLYFIILIKYSVL